jgi:hypothetical protein
MGEPVAETPKIGFPLGAPSRWRHETAAVRHAHELNATTGPQSVVLHSGIVEKLDLKIPSGMQRPGLDKAVNYLEQLCHEQLVPPEIDESHVSTKVLPNRRQAGGWLESEVWVEKTKGFIQTRVKDSIKPSASVF